MISQVVKYISLLMFSILSFSCSLTEFEDSAPENPSEVTDPAEISAGCSFSSLGYDGIPVKGLVGPTTLTGLQANFVKLDERRTEGWKPSDYVMEADFKWTDERTRILEAEIMSSPDNAAGIYARSVIFKPRQTYQYSIVEPENPAEPGDTLLGYVSRMIGWYPKTFSVPTDQDGVPSDVSFSGSDSYVRVEDGGIAYDCVLFKNKLDGKTDVMMTDMREGRIDLSHRKEPFRNNISDTDVQPYGLQYKNFLDPNSGFRYCNYFTFNHYLTAVRLFVNAENSDLSLLSWKQINDVVFVRQPATLAVSLPREQRRDPSKTALVDGTTASLPKEGVEPVFGKAVKWDDFKNMQIIKTAMSGNDSGYPEEFSQVPSYPVIMQHSVDFGKTYLGYMLIRPDVNTRIELHTDAGVFSAVIPTKCGYTDAEGNVTETEILKAGNIYNVTINIKTDGSLDMIVGSEDTEIYKNLTPFNSKYQDFEYSNCYVITPDDMTVPGNSMELYDGFYFHAVTPGRGPKGAIEGTSADLYPSGMLFSPRQVKVLWQDHPYLISHVELVHDYVRFGLNRMCQEKTDRLTGNAVIGIYDDDNRLIWSWHIWVTDCLKDITYKELDFMDVEDGDFGDNIFSPRVKQPKKLTDVTMMNMNLGATLSQWTGPADVLKTYGLYYQWGRKDPSPLPPSYDYSQADLSTSPYYYMDQGKKDKVHEIFHVRPVVETGARDPLGIVAPSQINETYANDWLYSSVHYLWGYSPRLKKIKHKTIYDPCPYGYRVADDELWALFYSGPDMASKNQKIIEETSDHLGFTLEGVGANASAGLNWFPFAGWRGHDRGRTDKTHAWYGVGELGDYQDARICETSTNYSNHRGRSLIIRKSLFKYDYETGKDLYTVNNVSPSYEWQATTDYANRTSASTVRCIRYDKNDEEPEDILR